MKNKQRKATKYLFWFLLFFLASFFYFSPIFAAEKKDNAINPAGASLLLDWKKFLLSYPDYDEQKLDFDGDGYGDDFEIGKGYSPFDAKAKKITESDTDSDGLSDYFEIKLKTDPLNSDSDGDGHKDGAEFDLAFNPSSSSSKRLERRIEINLKKQELTYFVSGLAWRAFTVSTGKTSMPTPTGNFKILNKIPKAWSATYKLWMPYWLGLGRFGIHELPIWPSGYREGENHLGKPVSHGCIRLGVGPAKYIFDRVDVNTLVIIK